jgi:hypothetical protein
MRSCSQRERGVRSAQQTHNVVRLWLAPQTDNTELASSHTAHHHQRPACHYKTYIIMLLLPLKQPYCAPCCVQQVAAEGTRQAQPPQVQLLQLWQV